MSEEKTVAQELAEIRNVIVGDEVIELTIKGKTKEDPSVYLTCTSLSQEEISNIEKEMIKRQIDTNDVSEWSKINRRLKLVFAMKEIKFKGKVIDTSDRIVLEDFLKTFPDKTIQAIYLNYENQLNEIYDRIIKKN